MKVVLLEPLNVPDETINELAQPIIDAGHEFVYYNERTSDVDELTKRSEGADVVIIDNTPYPAEIINANEDIKLIDVAFTGVDHIGIQDADNKDIIISNAAGYANQAVAELAVGLVLDLYRQITQGDKDTRLAGDFPGPIQGREIKGKTVGIIGTGNIGIMTAKLFKAFGADLLGYSNNENPEAKELDMEYVELDELLERSDIVSLHVPLTDSTAGMISADKLKLMKESAVLINCARGGVVDNDALADALNNGEISGAGIDVFDMEPPIPADYKLLSAKNTILTPHIGFLSDEAMVIRAEIAFDNAIAFLNGKPQNVVDV